MDKVWMIMTWIVYGFEIFGIGLILVGSLVMMTNPGASRRIDKIRNYILMQDEEDFK